MVILDTVLARRQAEGNPVRVGVVGAGYMGRGIVLQILSAIPGMRVCAVANRTLSKAEQAYVQGGVEEVVHATSVSEIEQAVTSNRYAITDDALLLCQAKASKSSSKPLARSTSGRA